MSAVALTFVVLLALVGVVLAKRAGLFGGDADGPQVGLIAANVVGEHPFMPSAVVSPVEVADTVAGDIASFRAQLPRSADRGARLVQGTQAGLYGGTEQVSVCDVPAVANYLDAHPERSAPWAQAIGIAAQKIPYYLNTLTPVVLTVDTWVTSFFFVEGRAESAQAVLQAGNAVLIDQVGVPRVLCATGAPLTPPANVNLSTLTIEGEAWPDFAPQNVVAVAYAGRGANHSVLSEFKLRDLTTGEAVTRLAGGTIAIGPDPSGWTPDPPAMNVPPREGMSEP